MDPILYHVILAVERNRGWEMLSEMIRRQNVKHLPEIPEFKVEGDVGDCAICQETIKIGEKIKRLPCSSTVNHVFHSECINPWFESNTTCPVCRSDIGGLELDVD